jgi:hypothetical protein
VKKTNKFDFYVAHFLLSVTLTTFADISGGDPSSKEYKQAVNVLLLCSALSILASNNLTREKIDFAERLQNYGTELFQMHSVNSFGIHGKFYLHLAQCTRKFGSSTSHSSFFVSDFFI